MTLADFWIYLGVLAGSVLLGTLIASWRFGRAYSSPRSQRDRRS